MNLTHEQIKACDCLARAAAAHKAKPTFESRSQLGTAFHELSDLAHQAVGEVSGTSESVADEGFRWFIFRLSTLLSERDALRAEVMAWRVADHLEVDGARKDLTAAIATTDGTGALSRASGKKKQSNG